MKPIACEADIAQGLAVLLEADPRLAPIIETAGPVPLRLQPAGFEGLCRIVVSQQLSVASARAIWARVEAGLGRVTPEAVLAQDEEGLRAMGLSRPKLRTLQAVSEAAAGGLDLLHLCSLDRDAAHAALTSVKGIGPWTAEIYLLFCAGHPDIFPARDVALQSAVASALGLEARPGEKALAGLAESWAPFRGTAARLFWAYYAAIKGRDGAPGAKNP